MKSINLNVALVLAFVISCQISAQNAGTKTAQDLKKAEKVTKAGKALVNVFKKKKKAEKENEKSETEESKELINETISHENENDIDLNPKKTIEPVEDIVLTKEAAALFINSKSKTTNAEKNEIAALMNLKVAPNSTQFYIDDEFSRDYPFTVFTYPIDINLDGVEEVALVYGHAAISGDNVISTLFIKDNDGHYKANFGFKGSLIILPNTKKTFPNFAIGGPGFEFPVWHWDGKNYSYHSRITDETLEKSKPLFIEEASRLYVESISN